MGFKSFLIKNGLVEDDGTTPIAPVATSVPVSTTPSVPIPVGRVDNNLLEELLDNIDTVGKFSFIQFYEANEQSTDLKSAVATITAIDPTLTRETLITQAGDSLKALQAFCDSKIAEGEQYKAQITQQTQTKRTNLDTAILAKEQELRDLQAERAAIDGVTDITNVNNELSKLKATKEKLSADIQSFINKL
jgi:hypothetical protein